MAESKGGVSTEVYEEDSTNTNSSQSEASNSPIGEEGNSPKKGGTPSVVEDRSKEMGLLSEQELCSPSVEEFDYQITPLEVFDDQAVDFLTDGFLDIFSPEFEKVLGSFSKLRTSQEEMLLSIEMKNQVFDGSPMTKDIIQTLQMVPGYREKLVSISRDMNLISRKVAKLKQRAKKLSELRDSMDEEKKRTEAKRRAKEKMLEAKPVVKEQSSKK